MALVQVLQACAPATLVQVLQACAPAALAARLADTLVITPSQCLDSLDLAPLPPPSVGLRRLVHIWPVQLSLVLLLPLHPPILQGTS